MLFHAIVFQPAVPILITDDNRRYRDASSGAGKLLGLPREKIIGRRLDDFATPAVKAAIPGRWQNLLKEGEQLGSLQLSAPDGTPREVEYIAKTNILPARNLLVLRDPVKADTAPSWVQDYALFLLDVDQQIAAWYGGAERIYGYDAAEAMQQPVSFLYPTECSPPPVPQEEFRRSVAEGHSANEGWHLKKDGSRFWANVITVALKNDDGDLQGFARMVRDFSDRHDRDEKLRRSLARVRRALRHRRSQALFPENLTAFPMRTIHFWNWSDTVAKIFSPAASCGPISRLKNSRHWTNLRMKKDCASGLVRPSKKN